MLTKHYRMTREKLLKSEALLTLSLKASFKANSAPTLHGEKNNNRRPGSVGALFAKPAVLIPPVVWHLSRPNCSLYRTRRPWFSNDESVMHWRSHPEWFRQARR
jgi:hypothetical protein